MTKTPFELRYDILKLAQNHVIQLADTNRQFYTGTLNKLAEVGKLDQKYFADWEKNMSSADLFAETMKYAKEMYEFVQTK